MLGFRHLLSPGFAFLMGIAAAIAVGAISDVYNWPRHEPWRVAERWGIREEVPGHLYIPVGGDPATHIEIMRSNKTGDLTMVTVDQAGTGGGLVYEPQAEYGVPWVSYSGKSSTGSITWFDRNGDGKWDERIDQARGVVEIRLGERWLRREGLLDDVAKTHEGSFRFDVTSGEWRPCSPAPPQAVDERRREP
jgi:hypothetical protein